MKRPLLIGFLCLMLAAWAVLGFSPTTAATGPMSLTPSPEPTELPTSIPATETPMVLPTETPTSIPVTSIPATETPTVLPATPIPATETPVVPATGTSVATAIPATNTPVPSPPILSPPATDTPTLPPSTATPVLPATATPLAPTQTPVPQRADPRLQKVVSATGPMAVGSELVYVLQVTAEGSVAATDVVATDALPAGLTLIRATASRGQVTTSGNTVRVVLGNVVPGEIVRIEIIATLHGNGTDAIVNVATLTTSSTTDIPSNNSDNAMVKILRVPDVQVPPTPTQVPAGVTKRRIPATDISDGSSLPVWPFVLVGLGLVGGAISIRRSLRVKI